MSPDQILALAERLQFDFYVYDEQIAHVFENSSLGNKVSSGLSSNRQFDRPDYPRGPGT